MSDERQITIQLKNGRFTLNYKYCETVTTEIREIMYNYVTEKMDYLNIYSTRFQDEIMSHRDAVSKLKTGKDLTEYYEFSEMQIFEKHIDSIKKSINKLSGKEKVNEIDNRIIGLKDIIERQKRFKQDSTDSNLILNVLELEKEKAAKELEVSKNDYQSKITGFETNLSNPEIKTLYKKIKGMLINNDTTLAHFIAALNNAELPEDYIKIHWKSEESMFCCLMFGYANLEYGNQSLHFDGIVKNKKKEYILATNLFSFRTKTNNKSLSSTVAKLKNCNSPNNFNLIYPIIKQY